MIVRALRWVWRLIREIGNNDLNNHAAEMAYYAMMSVFPFFLLLTTTVAFLDIPDLFEKTMDLLAQIAPEEVVRLLRDTIYQVTTVQRTQLLGVTTAVCVWMSVGAMGSTTRGLNKAFGLRDPRHYARFFLLTLGMTFFIGLLLIVSIVLLLLGPKIEAFVHDRVDLGQVGRVLFLLLRYAVPLLFLFIAHAGLYWLCPAMRRSFRVFSPGTIFSVSGWIAVSIGFKGYLERVNNYDKLYGSLGAVILTLFWFYLMSLVLLIGAQIDAVLHPEYKNPDAEMAKPEREPIRWRLTIIFIAVLIGVPLGIRYSFDRSTFTPEARDIGGELGKMIEKSLATGTQDFDHEDFQTLLEAHVDEEGLVDYAALDQEFEKLDAYIKRLESAPIGELSPEELHALLLNLHNATALRLIQQNHERIQFTKDIPEFENQPVAKLAGQEISLADIRDRMLRPHFPFARNHFALSDGSRGSSPLMRFAYEGEQLQEQLDIAAKTALARPRVRIEDDTLLLPSVVSRFAGDFEQAAIDRQVMTALLPYLGQAGTALYYRRGADGIGYQRDDFAINAQP